MLRKLRVQNFFSIGPMVELDLSVAKNAPEDRNRFARPVPGDDSRFAKVAVLYGPNASGKTNVLRAAAFVLELVRDSFRWKVGELLPYVPCMIDGCPDEPSVIAAEFDISTHENQSRERYSYNIIFRYENIIEESLYRFGSRRKLLFERKGGNVRYGPDFYINSTLKKVIRLQQNASVISTLASYQHGESNEIIEALGPCFTNVDMAGKRPLSYQTICQHLDLHPDMKPLMAQYLQSFDIDIERIDIIHGDHGIDAKFIHSSIPSGVPRVFESQGTLNLFKIAPYVNNVLAVGAVAFIDELDSDLHPTIVAEIVRRFNSTENTKNAQLIMTCHNPALLRHLNKDEVHIVERDQDMFTRITALRDIPGVRRDANLEAQYLGGAFGGLPLLA